MKILNRVAFSCFVAGILLLSIFSDSPIFFVDIDKPWHLQPFVHEDSLCQMYKEHYKILVREPLISTEIDTARPVTVILVDAWGVPLDSSLMEADFEFFKNLPARFMMHKRLANRNTHAEGVELRNTYAHSTFFFGGDSLEYDRKQYIPKLNFDELVFCGVCSDEAMLAKLDSAILDSAGNAVPKMLAWTTGSARDGNRENLHRTLEGIANLAAKHPEMQFIVVGTHRPILGTPETRRMYHAHWVPAVVINR